MRSQLLHLIHRNIQGSLLVARAVFLRGTDIHQHDIVRGVILRRHHHGGGSRSTFRVPPLQPDEEGRQPGHHHHVQNHVFHASTSLNHGGGIKRKQCLSSGCRQYLLPTPHRRGRPPEKRCSGDRRKHSPRAEKPFPSPLPERLERPAYSSSSITTAWEA